jgi:phosphate transport system substrate-binding protein
LTRQSLSLTAIVALAATGGYSQSWSADQLATYQPRQKVSGVISLWGHGSFKRDFMGRLVKAWEEGFARYQPGIQFDYRMYGTASSIGALYAGVGDIAIRGEEINPFEVAAFERVLHYPPLCIEIATGSLDVRNMNFAQIFFVHKDNPISKLTMVQLDAIFGYEHRRGDRQIRTWGQLGFKGEWADRPIHVYGWRIDDDFSAFLQIALLGGSHRWNCDLKEFANIVRPDGSTYDSGQQIVDALAQDRYGIAVSNLRYGNAQVKPLALAVRNGGPYYEAARDNLIYRKYPLTRIVPAYINRAPGKPADPKVKEFMRFILSREGQLDIVREGGYLPLSRESALEQLKKLE